MDNDQDVSMSWDDNGAPNWDTFSFEEELLARKSKSNTFLEELGRIVGVSLKTVNSSGPIEDMIQDNFKTVQSHNEKLQTKGITLNNEAVKLTKEIENLKIKKENLETQLKDITESVKVIKDEYKQCKEAYDLALKAYLTNFDLDVKIEPVSDEVFNAFVTFNSLADMKPIKVIINRIQRSIIGFHCELLENEENWKYCDNKNLISENKALLLAEIRNFLLNK